MATELDAPTEELEVHAGRSGDDDDVDVPERVFESLDANRSRVERALGGARTAHEHDGDAGPKQVFLMSGSRRSRSDDCRGGHRGSSASPRATDSACASDRASSMSTAIVESTIIGRIRRPDIDCIWVIVAVLITSSVPICQ